jgi:ubiquinone/menaquinone biosynthesis C-methylase UbiE
MTKEKSIIGQLLETSGSYWRACTLHAGVSLEIFTLIGDDCIDGDEIARRSGGDADGVKRLLNALTAMGLLTKQQSEYANTPESKSLLVKDSPEYIGHIIMHHHHLVSAWSRLPEAVRSGEQVRERSSFGKEEERESFLMGMFNLAMNIAPRVVDQIDLSGRNHLIDLGGGPGTYAIHFCKANPSLRATVYDLSTTEPFATKTIERFGLRDRIDFVAGNYIEGDIKGSYDVAWVSHILHGEGPEDCQSIIRKVISVLEPGGLILIHDFILNDNLDGPLFPALFSLNMLINTQHGQSYSESQITSMLAKAGAKEINRIPFQGPNDSGIIACVV